MKCLNSKVHPEDKISKLKCDNSSTHVSMFSKQQNATGPEYWKSECKKGNAVWSCGEWKRNWNVSVLNSENRGINITCHRDDNKRWIFI